MTISQLIQRDIVRNEMMYDILTMEGNKKVDRAIVHLLSTILNDEFAEDEMYVKSFLDLLINGSSVRQQEERC
jgi:hypothetical protein